MWDSYLSFGSSDNLLVRILIQVDRLVLLYRWLSPSSLVQIPGPGLQEWALWINRERNSVVNAETQCNPVQ